MTMGEITEDKVKVYQLIADIVLKFILGIGAFVLLCIIIKAFLNEDNAYTKTTYGAVAGILSGCIYLPFRHYFTTNKKPSTPQKKAAKKQNT